MNLKKEAYFVACTRAEKAELMFNIEDESERVNLAKKNAEEMKNSALKASEQYLTSLAEEKQVWSDCEESRKCCIDSLRESEESRIQFVKKILEKNAKLEFKFFNALLDDIKSLSGLYTLISPKEEASKFQVAHLNIPQIPREEWTPYDTWKKNMKNQGKAPLEVEEAWISSNIPYTPMQSSLALIKTVVYHLIPFKQSHSGDAKTETGSIDTIDNALIDQLVDLLTYSNTWMSFIQVLELRKHLGYVEVDNLHKLEKFIHKILTIMLYEESFDYMIFYKIISISHEIYTLDSGKKFFFKYLCKHPVFLIQSYWKKTIEALVSARVISEKEIHNRNRQRLKKIGAKIQNASNFSEKAAEKNSTLMFISEFNYYMTNFRVPLDSALSVIIECSKKTKLEPDKLQPLIIELHSLNPEVKFESSNRRKSLRKSSKTRGKWGKYLFLGLSVDYLCKKDVINVMCACKTWYSLLKPNYLQKILIVYKIFEYRKATWEYFLYKPNGKSYTKILETLENNLNSIKSVEDVIAMDILRSYSNKPTINPENLRNILRCYAFYQNKVGYCQGMNYIAGTLYIVFQDPEKTFWCMDELIRINSMYDLYSEDLPKLKFLFFAFDRLTAFLLPDIHETFNVENVTSASFSSSWFLTLFASILVQNIDLLLEIWDLFIYVRRI
jgi:Rab-GTPase-TBC domain